MHVHVWAPAIETGPLDARVARVLTCENGELVLGRLRHRDDGVVVEHTILAGTTMDAGRGAVVGVGGRLGRGGMGAAPARAPDRCRPGAARRRRRRRPGCATPPTTSR